MMGRAKIVMEEQGADFLVSGEVLGQRPMSQRLDALRIVERDSGVAGYLVRPLSARLLKPTVPEEKGLVDRERLLDISGRSRKRQMKLAEQFGISDYETPAGGCLLTDPIISRRIEKLLKECERVTAGDVQLITVGRHYTLKGGSLYVGRNKDDNLKIASLVRAGDYTLKAKARPGPLALFRGVPDGDDLTVSARVVARYSDKTEQDEVSVSIAAGAREETVTVTPIEEDLLEALRTKY
jgi:tRNA-specific 2-thiouridylase